MRVGTKQLKNRLSHYLRRVRGGDAVQVTDRGRVVAELRGVLPDAADTGAALRELADEGAVALAEGKPRPMVPIRARKPLRLSRLVLDGRR